MIFAAHVAMAATTVQMTPVADATLYENGAGLYANSQGAGVFAGLNGGGAIRRALVRFDLSSLPADATVTNVSLKLVVTRSLSGFSDLSFHRITAAWQEGPSNAGGSRDGTGVGSQAGDPTWMHSAYSGSLWATPGGDFVAPASDVMTFISGLGTYTQELSGLITDVQAWLDGTANYGWIIRGNEAENGSAKRLGSSEDSVLDRPVLTITYESSGVVPEPQRMVLLMLGVAAIAWRRCRR